MAANASRIPDAVLESSGVRLLVDVAIVIAWIALATVAFRTTGWPVTAYYAVVFAGVLAYSLAIDPWEWERERGRGREQKRERE